MDIQGMLIDFSTLKINNSTPIYQQIVKFVKIKIALGEVEPGDELPSRRMLSVILNVNPNTIQKCCKIMEDEGFVQSQAGAKSVLYFDDDTAEQMKQTLYIEEVDSFIGEMKRLKMQKEQVVEAVDLYWAQGGNDETDN